MGCKIMLAVTALVQDSKLPTTVYWVLLSGLLVKVLPTEASLHVYVVAPETVNVPTVSGQMETSLIESIGVFTKLTAMVLLVEQVLASVLCRVYM